jgi:hypothetical protein
VLDELVALIQSPGHEGEVLYQDHADYLRALYDETAISFCTTIRGRICGVLTVHMAHTEWGDLVSYASMLKVRTSLTNVSIDGERSSHLLIAAWMRYVDRLMPVRGTAHLVTQSVGYKYILEAGTPVCVPSDTHVHGFQCWRNHLFEPATNAAITFGFLLGIAKGPEFLDPDCCILYRTLRKLGAFFSLSLCARRCMRRVCDVCVFARLAGRHATVEAEEGEAEEGDNVNLAADSAVPVDCNESSVFPQAPQGGDCVSSVRTLPRSTASVEEGADNVNLATDPAVPVDCNESSGNPVQGGDGASRHEGFKWHRRATKWRDASIVGAITRALAHLGICIDGLDALLFESASYTDVNQVRRVLSKVSVTFDSVMTEFNLPGGPLLAVLGCKRPLILKVFNDDWIGFVYYDGTHLFHNTSTCVAPKSSPHAMHECLETLVRRSHVRLKNVYETKRM